MVAPNLLILLNFAMAETNLAELNVIGSTQKYSKIWKKHC